MYSAAFIWEPGTYDAEICRLNAIKGFSTRHIVVSQVLRSYSDGAFEHGTPNAHVG